MTLHKKTILIIALTLVLLVGLLYMYSRVFFVGSFKDLEQENVERDVQRALSALSNNISTLNSVTCDYAWWDDTYQFVMDRNEAYMQSNLVDSTFSKNKLSLILIIDAAGRVQYEKGYNLDKNEEMRVPESIYQHILENNRLVKHTDEKEYVAGLLNLPEGCMIIASRPILTSEGEGPIRGTLIMARFLNSLEVKRLSLSTHLLLNMYQINDPEIRTELAEVDQRFWDSGKVEVKPLDFERIAGYALVRDIYGEPAMILRIEQFRAIFLKGVESIHFFIVALMISGSIIGFVIMKLLRRVILNPLANLSKELQQIGEEGALSARVPVVGKDEISRLGLTINEMLEALENFQKSETRYVMLLNQLQTTHKQLTEIIEFLPDATLVIDQDRKVIAWNQAIEVMSGVAKEDMMGKGDYAYAVPFYGSPRPGLIDLVWSNDLEIEKQYEYVKRRGNTLIAEVFVPFLYGGKGAFLMVTASPLFDSEGNQVGAIESIRDITERKVAEEKQKYFSLHDSLTRLYNRTYFEQMMTELEKDEFTPVGIILSDVDGLKIVNDTLGHDIGDKLLLASAEILRNTVDDSNVVARIGGDEFAILLPRHSASQVEDITNQLRNAVEKYNQHNAKLPVSISFGYATTNEGTSLRDIFKEADNNMYREKLYHSQSNRSALVQTLMKALEARDFMTEGHAERLQDLIASVGLIVGLPENKVRDLRLLAQFHDIGKVGIPDRILFKKGPLTADEYAEMKRHCEIGYRIAQGSPELAAIADGILKHHERWDGKGYPLGLSGEEIPIECRILALADSYDAMTQDRPYRKAMPKEKVIAELRKCSGTQFDPNLVEKFISVLEQEEHLLSEKLDTAG